MKLWQDRFQKIGLGQCCPCNTPTKYALTLAAMLLVLASSRIFLRILLHERIVNNNKTHKLIFDREAPNCMHSSVNNNLFEQSKSKEVLKRPCLRSTAFTTFFKWANPGLFFIQFCLFGYSSKYLVASGIQTRIFGAVGESADH